MAALPLPSRGLRRGWKCYVTPAFLGMPNAKRGEENQKSFPTKGNKIRSGRLTLPSPGAQKRVEMLRHPNAKRGEENQKWSRTQGGKTEVAASPVPSQGPTRGRK